MSDPLLPYYEQELTFIRQLGAEFARANPKIAGRLRLMEEGSDDPHVSRLIEAFAYLNARTRHKLEDDFPELTDALLGVLYPHYQAPIPAMGIAQFVLDRGQGELTTGYSIDRESVVETEQIEGEPCRFRTAYPVTLWPIELTAAGLAGRPFTAPLTSFSQQAVSVLRLQFRPFSKDVSFNGLPIGSLRFFLKGQPQLVYPLYEMIFNNTLGIAVAGSARDAQPVRLGRDAIRPVGFNADEALLPYSARSLVGYRLLTEFFAFPEKFLFFDLGGLDPKTLAGITDQLEIYLYFNRSLSDLERNVSADMFRLGCAPLVNLFPQRAEPITLNQNRVEYRIVPDSRRPLAAEVYSVDRVVATSADQEEVEFQPFYSFKHASQRGQQRFWHSTRRPSAGGEALDPGTEVYLSLVDLGFRTSAPADATLDIETTCLNRDLPHRLPFGGGQPYLELVGGGPLSRIAALTPFTETLRPALKRGALWRIISHLSLNHLSLESTREGADALREILALYDFADSSETRSMIEGVVAVRSKRVVGRSSGGPSGGFCRGLEIGVQLDEERFNGSGAFLFAAVLERFMGLYCSVNSFSKLVLTTRQREGELKRWPPRAGERVLL